MSNKVVVESIKFHINILDNYQYAYDQAKYLRDPQKRDVYTFAAAIRDQSAPLSAEQRNTLKKGIITVLETNAPPPPTARESLRAERRLPPAPKNPPNLGKLSPIEEILPSCLAFLAPKEIAKLAVVNSIFHKSSWPAYFEQLQTPQSLFSWDSLSKQQEALQLEKISDVLKFIPRANFLQATEIDLNCARDDFNEVQFQSFIAGFSDRVIKIDLGRCNFITAGAVTHMVKALPHLTAINYRHNIHHTGFVQMVQSYSHLREINLSLNREWVTDTTLDTLTTSCRELTHLDLTHCRQITNTGLQHISRCTNLEVLDLTGNDKLFHAEDPNADPQAVNPPLIEALEGFEAVAQTCTRLAKLTLAGTLVTDGVFQVIGTRCTALTDLDVCGCYIGQQAINSLIAGQADLRSINLQGQRSYGGIDSDSLFDLVKRFRNLQTLHIDSTIKMSPDVARDLLRSFPLLEPFGRHETLIETLKKELKYKPSSDLGKLYQAIFKEDDRTIDPLFSGIKDQVFLNRIYAHIEKLSKNVQNWGKDHIFDDLDILFQAFQLALVEHTKALPKDQADRLYGIIYSLAGSPKTDDDQWGEHHALDNNALLADALSHLWS